MTSPAERARAYRARKGATPRKDLAPCGTWPAAMRHYKSGGYDAVRACPECHEAWGRHNAEQYQRRRTRNMTEES